MRAQTLNQVQKRIGKGGSTSQVFPPKDKLQEEALIAVKFHTLHAYLVISRLLRSSPRHPIPLQLFSSSPHGSPSAQPHPSRIESTRLNSCKALSSCLELLAARSAAAWVGGAAGLSQRHDPPMRIPTATAQLSNLGICTIGHRLVWHLGGSRWLPCPWAQPLQAGRGQQSATKFPVPCLTY